MATIDIAVMPGDGIGPEIIREGLKVLNTAAEIEGISLKYHSYPFGAEHYLECGELIPASAMSEFKQQHAIYFGAAGDPRVEPGILEQGLIFAMRFELDQYINLRPVRLFPNVDSPVKNAGQVDIQLVRENSEDFYIQAGRVVPAGGGAAHGSLPVRRGIYTCEFGVDSHISTGGEYAYNLGLISRAGAERAARYAFELAARKGRDKVTCITKRNAVPQMYAIWEEAFYRVAEDYPQIRAEHSNVDAASMWMVKRPEDFSVVLAPNLFGDILSDLSAAVCGGLGFGGSGNINPNGVSMFEPIHGSAPKYAGKNVVNPIATILAGAMMMEHLGERGVASRIEQAVYDALASGMLRTKDMGGTAKTSEVGDWIVEHLRTAVH